jgi:signal transduction histidine kinase/CheY-like chemotaxis protein
MRLLVFLLLLHFSIATANDKTTPKDSVNYYLKLSKTNLKKNNIKLGTAYLERAQLILEKTTTDYNHENFKLKIASLKSEKAYQKINATSKLINILAVALVSILSLLSISLYKNNLFRLKSNQLLLEKNKELEIAKENAEKASKARSEFLSTVSHELRTPLNAINGITHLLIEEKPRENQLNYLNSLQFSGNYLLNFINDILEINRIESENIPIESINCDLKLQLEKIQTSFNEIAEINNNTFILEVDELIPNNLIYDPTKLSQILINLVNNSLKFTDKGYVKLSAKFGEVHDKIVTINFKVADNGIGIPEDKIDTIFDSFSQGSIEINRKYGGTGLGLAIVKKLIELLGGTIYLNSKVGLGTTFSFDLPFEIGGELPVLKSEIEYNERNLSDKKILLVEDNKINQMITKKMLENKGVYCDILDNGEAAIETLKSNHNYDLVLMDVHLPGVNGTIATQKIREFNQTIPIIALTAISLNENREMLLSYGMTDVVTKPFEPLKFYKTISDNLK